MSAPSALAVLSSQTGNTVVSEAGVSGTPLGNTFRMYVEVAGNLAATERGSISTGVALANPGASPAVVNVELFNTEGASTGLRGSLTIPPSAQKANFVHDIAGLNNLPLPFTGTMRIVSDKPISILGIRGRYNEASNFLMTTLPAFSEGPVTNAERVFPHLADGGGFTTQFILMNTNSGGSTGVIKYFNGRGQPLGLRMQN
jgi:hypothetical protein